MTLWLFAFLILSSMALPAVAAALSPSVWYAVGPFAVGKTEFDADPVEARGGILRLYSERLSKSKLRIPSEVSSTGWVSGWTSFRADGGLAVAHWDNVADWDDTVRSMSSMEAMSFQSWAIGSITTPASPSVTTSEPYGTECTGVHSFFITEAGIDAARLFAGDVYGQAQDVDGASRNLGFNIVQLMPATEYLLYFRLRGRNQVPFSCRVQPLHKAVSSPLLKPLKVDSVFDIWDGQPALNSTVVSIVCWNPSTTTIAILFGEHKNINFSGVLKGFGAIISVKVSFDMNAIHGDLSVFPGQTAPVPLTINLLSPLPFQFATDKENCALLSINILPLVGGHDAASITLRLNCRARTQSFLWTFIDHDGTANHAASIAPTQLQKAATDEPVVHAFPILVTLSGVGVDARQAADSHKYKAAATSPHFTFGLRSAWVLAPHRHGAHNWEGQGMLACTTAIDELAARTNHAANRNELLVDGHSRGGHGAWMLASRMPDRVLGLHVASGWYNRQYYGDSNTLFLHDLQLLHVDAALRGVLESTILENDNSLHVSNLCGIPTLIRSGGADRAVPPWMSRRMARHMEEVCVHSPTASASAASVQYHEFAGKDHWWWDTESPNDGGVLFDKETRRFWAQVLNRSSSLDSPSLQNRFTVTALAPHPYEGRHGVRIVAQEMRYRLSAITVDRVKTAMERISTENVKSFAMKPHTTKDCHQSIREIDGQRIDKTDLLCSDRIDTEVFRKDARGQWSAHSAVSEAAGSTRQVFDRPWKIVIGTGQDPASKVTVDQLREIALYVANHHALAQGTLTSIVYDEDELPKVRSTTQHHRYQYMLLGGANVNSVSRFLMADTEFYQHLFSNHDDGVLTIRGTHTHACAFDLQKHAAAILIPERDGPRPLMHLLLDSRSPTLLRQLVHYTFSSDQALTRAAFSNMFTDLFVVDERFAATGYGGLVAAGWWGSGWDVRGFQGYVKRCHVSKLDP